MLNKKIILQSILTTLLVFSLQKFITAHEIKKSISISAGNDGLTTSYKLNTPSYFIKNDINIILKSIGLIVGKNIYKKNKDTIYIGCGGSIGIIDYMFKRFDSDLNLLSSTFIGIGYQYQLKKSALFLEYAMTKYSLSTTEFQYGTNTIQIIRIGINYSL